MKIKFHWGKGIFIVYTLFALLSVSTAVFWMNQDVHLVTDNYYEKELDYQQQIDRIYRTGKLKENLGIKYNNRYVQILIPEIYVDKKITGDVNFYRPSDPGMDLTIPLQPDSSGVQNIPVKNLAKGYWKVKVLWGTDTLDYYTEKAIHIN